VYAWSAIAVLSAKARDEDELISVLTVMEKVNTAADPPSSVTNL
jgi:hypothetical protein